MPYMFKYRDTLYNEEWLRKVYVEENRNAAQVAELIGATTGAVLDNLRKYKIPIKDGSEAQKLAPHVGTHTPRPRTRFLQTLHNPDWLKKHYVDEDLSISKLAFLAGASIPSTLRALQVAEIPIKPKESLQGRPNPKRRVNIEDASTVTLRARATRNYPPGPCVVCGEEGQEVNHKDRNPRNSRLDNLERLCKLCHHKQHSYELWYMISKLQELGVHYKDIHTGAREWLKSGKEVGSFMISISILDGSLVGCSPEDSESAEHEKYIEMVGEVLEDAD